MEYPTTRVLGASPRARAEDIHAAFADPSVKAVIASIGGDDQITVLPFLDRELLRANPESFFGTSDNTNLPSYLHGSRIVGYHGARVMCELGRPGAMAPLTAGSLRAVLFTSGPYELRPADRFREVDLPWDDPENLTDEPPTEEGGGWTWHRPERVVEGRSWGGSIEILSWLLMADREIPDRAPAMVVPAAQRHGGEAALRAGAA